MKCWILLYGRSQTAPPPNLIRTGSEISCLPGSGSYPTPPEHSPTAQTSGTMNPLGAVSSDGAQLNTLESSISVPVLQFKKKKITYTSSRLATEVPVTHSQKICTCRNAFWQIKTLKDALFLLFMLS